jgi:hypothetical protein
MTAQRTLDTLRAYVAAYRFLQLTLPVLCADDTHGAGAWFLLHNGELSLSNGLVSSDPAYWPDDWDAATGNARALDPSAAHHALLRFLNAYSARGTSAPLRAAIERFAETNAAGVPVDEALRGAWERAWSEAEATTTEAQMVSLTQPVANP